MIKIFLIKFLHLAKLVFNFLKKECPKIHWVEHSYDNSLDSKIDILPKEIWIYWDSDEKNDLVEFCIYNIKKLCPDYRVNILNSKNINEYIELPIFKSELKKATISDYIRFALLKKYGGIWMDASMLLTENFDWFMNKMKSKENFIFYSDQCTIDKNNPIVESWFIAARKNSQFIKDWFNEFEKCCLSENPSTYYKNYRNNPVIQKIPNTDYLMCYISAAIVLSKKKYSILYANAGSAGHYYNYKLYSSSYLIGLKLFKFNKKNIYIPPLVKFTKDTRSYASLIIRDKMYTNKSLFYKDLEDYYASLDLSENKGAIK